MKKLLSVAATLGVASAIAFGAAPAYAADAPALPTGQALYNIDCDTVAPQLWSFTVDGASTPVGSKGVEANCAGGGQTNPVDGKSYIIAYAPNKADALATVDLTTGAITIVAPINGAAGGAWQLIITNSGAAFISGDTGASSSRLYGIDLTTATTTLIGSVAPVNLGAMGYDYKTDTIYAFNRSNTRGVYTIDRTTGVATNTGLSGYWPTATCLGGGTSAGRPDGVAFDANGIAWIQSDSCNSNVMAFDPASGNSWITGELFDSTATKYTTSPFSYYSETFLIAPIVVNTPLPAPALASTGADLRAVPLVGISAAIAALLGVILLTSRRPRKA